MRLSLDSTVARRSSFVGSSLITKKSKLYNLWELPFSDELICQTRITNLFDGSPAATIRRRQLEALIRNHPTNIFCNEENAYLHRTSQNWIQ